MSTHTDSLAAAAADAVTAPLDLLLTDAALGTLRRMNPGGSGLRLAGALAVRPSLVASQGRNCSARWHASRWAAPRYSRPGETGGSRIRHGRATRCCAACCRRYLAAAQATEGLVAGAELDWADSERVGFALTNLVDALAPSNSPVLNPAAVKAVIDTGGGSAVAGLRHFVADMAAPPRVPSMVEPDAFEVGADLAVTPGAVVLRTPVFELIQYRPVTTTVRQVPLLIVPPTINKFYVIDLAPGRSMAEYLVGQGQQVFMISWRNPDARHADWDFDTYGQAVLDAMDAAARITGSERTAVPGCARAASSPRWWPRTWRSPASRTRSPP